MSWFEGFTLQRWRVNCIEIVGRIGGNPAKPALVLIHGFPQSHVMWHRVAQALARDYMLVMPDLRGYGDSTALPGSLDHVQASKREMARDIVGVLDALGVGKAYVCGHDRGGRVAHRLALDYPERVAKLCLIDIAPTLDMYARTDMAFARAYYHWFHLIQPSPLPESMILGTWRSYLHVKLGAGVARALLLSSRVHWSNTNATSNDPNQSPQCVKIIERGLARIFHQERRFAHGRPRETFAVYRSQLVRCKTTQRPPHPKLGRLAARCFAPRAPALGLSHRAPIHPDFGLGGHCPDEICGLASTSNTTGKADWISSASPATRLCFGLSVAWSTRCSSPWSFGRPNVMRG